jgi:hypothetical protein
LAAATSQRRGNLVALGVLAGIAVGMVALLGAAARQLPTAPDCYKPLVDGLDDKAILPWPLRLGCAIRAPQFAAVATDPSRTDRERFDALSGLAAAGTWARIAAPSLRALAADQAWSDPALFALTRVDPEAATQEALRRLGSEPRTQWMSLITLRNLGPAARAAVPAIAPLLDSEVHGPDAAHALGAIGGAEATALLGAALQKPNWRTNYDAAIGLGEQGRDAGAWVGALEELARTHWLTPLRPFFAKVAQGIRAGRPLEMSFSERMEVPLPSCAGALLHRGRRRAPPDAEGVTVRRTVANGELFGVNRGEFGGGLYFRAPSGAETLLFEEPWQALLPETNGYAGLAGLDHLGLSQGYLLAVRQAPSGQWSAVPRMRLLGMPRDWWQGPDGTLRVASYGGVMEIPASGPPRYLGCVEVDTLQPYAEEPEPDDSAR